MFQFIRLKQRVVGPDQCRHAYSLRRGTNSKPIEGAYIMACRGRVMRPSQGVPNIGAQRAGCRIKSFRQTGLAHSVPDMFDISRIGIRRAFPGNPEIRLQAECFFSRYLRLLGLSKLSKT
jgi:hypothetical protein